MLILMRFKYLRMTKPDTFEFSVSFKFRTKMIGLRGTRGSLRVASLSMRKENVALQTLNLLLALTIPSTKV